MPYRIAGVNGRHSIHLRETDMSIDNLTIGEAKEIAGMFGGSKFIAAGTIDHGLCVVVLDRGFVYVGSLRTDDKFLTITDAKNIRRWGTNKGLGQLALEGAQANTVLDNVGTVKALIGELKHFILCEVSAWKK
jgi:hypothetical protein